VGGVAPGDARVWPIIARQSALRRVPVLALAAIVVAFVAAEIVHPTTYAPKRSTHIAALSLTNDAPIDSLILDDLPPIAEQALGNIDVRRVVVSGRAAPITNDATIPLDGTLVLAGWCADPIARTRGQTIFIIADGHRRLVTHRAYGVARADVATYFAAPSLTDVGFTIEIAARELGLGKHTLQVALVSADSRGFYRLPTVVRLTVSH